MKLCEMWTDSPNNGVWWYNEYPEIAQAVDAEYISIDDAVMEVDPNIATEARKRIRNFDDIMIPKKDYNALRLAVVLKGKKDIDPIISLQGYIHKVGGKSLDDIVFDDLADLISDIKYDAKNYGTHWTETW